jgi:hypothetical protein
MFAEQADFECNTPAAFRITTFRGELEHEGLA